MRLKSTIHTSVFISIVFLLLLTSKIISSKITIPTLLVSKQESATNYKSNLLRYSSLGNSRFLSSILWVQTLIESDIQHYQKNDLNSWMFLRFNTITSLDPHFYEAYLYGGQYLSVIKNDVVGAQVIYDKGLQQFPDDYNLNFYAAFNYYFELNDITNALKHYDRIIDHPKMPKYLPSLIAKMKIESGDNTSTALELIKNAYLNAKEGSPMRKHFLRSYYTIKTKIDLKCLNQTKGKGCNKRDLLGNPYPKNKEGAYEALPLKI